MLQKGIPTSPGIVIGKAYLHGSGLQKVIKRILVSEAEVQSESELFLNAVATTKIKINKIRCQFLDDGDHSEAMIFDAHLLILDDSMLIDETINRIRKEKVNADYALDSTIEKLIQAFNSIQDPYLQERSNDIRDIGNWLLRELLNEEIEIFSKTRSFSNLILVAHELTPSETVHIHKGTVLGFVTEVGGRTSHTAILARSLEIPAVVGINNIIASVKPNDTLILDGNNGIVIIDPTPEEIKRYEDLRCVQQEESKKLAAYCQLPAITKDGVEIDLRANIEFPEEIDIVKVHGAQGIGLYRTEYLFMQQDKLPTEEEQFSAFCDVATRMAPDEVIIRTLDIGGEKQISGIKVPHEENPVLGIRAIRLCMLYKPIFRTHLRAILRASAYKNLSIMIPLITAIEELREVKVIIESVKDELRVENIDFNDNIRIGTMIEVPALATITDLIADEVDFLSLGTNDLVQYALAVERSNEHVAYLYQFFHPGVLRMIAGIIAAAKAKKKWIGICGEMAGDPYAAILMIGMGIESLSMSGIMIPECKKTIRSISKAHAERAAVRVLNLPTSQDIIDYMESEFSAIIS